MQNYIESQANKKFKAWQKLLRRKYREQQGEYLIEGGNLLEDALKSGIEIKELILCHREDANFDLTKYISQKLIDGIVQRCVRIYFLKDVLFDRLQETENGRDVIAVVKMQKSVSHKNSEFRDSNKIKAGNGEENRSNSIVVLDRLQDPGNIGTIIRTCDGAGFAAIAVLKGTADVYSAKVIRAAAGSLFRVPIIHIEDIDSLTKLTKENGLSIVATGFDTESYYFEEDLADNIALVIGNEGGGISREIFDIADKIIKIPMCGDINSLNAAVSAGIIMYESLRQRKQAEKSVK